MRVSDPFEGIARDYDRMFLRDIDADRGMLVTLLEASGAKTVLDCACGTGVHTRILAEEGYDVTGSDASEAMLAVAREKLSSTGLEVDLYRSSWSGLPGVLPGVYDAVICMGNSLVCEPDAASVTRSLAGMYSVLDEGGVLLVSGSNADRQLSELVGLEVVEPERECFLLDVRDFTDEKTFHTFYFIDAAGGEPSLRRYSFELLNLTAGMMEGCARGAGIEEFALYGDKDFTPYSRHESERLILVARKGATPKGG